MSLLARKKKLLMLSAASVAAATFAGSSAVTATGSPQTISSAPIGTAAATRYVVVAVGVLPSTIAPSVSAITVAGQSCSLITSSAAQGGGLYLFITDAPVTSGTTASVVVTYGGNTNRIFVATWAVTGLNSTTATDTDTSTTNGASVTSSITAGGVCIAAAISNSTVSAGTFTWTGVTEDVETSALTNGRMSGASKASAGGESLSLSATSTQANQGYFLVAASFR